MGRALLRHPLNPPLCVQGLNYHIEVCFYTEIKVKTLSFIKTQPIRKYDKVFRQKAKKPKQQTLTGKYILYSEICLESSESTFLWNETWSHFFSSNEYIRNDFTKVASCHLLLLENLARNYYNELFAFMILTTFWNAHNKNYFPIEEFWNCHSSRIELHDLFSCRTRNTHHAPSPWTPLATNPPTYSIQIMSPHPQNHHQFCTWIPQQLHITLQTFPHSSFFTRHN